jgi:hypothetical protein
MKTSVITGLKRGELMDTYRQWPYASQSLLKIFRDKSPAHAHEYILHPPEQTPAMVLGTAVHMAVLQPDLFPTHYAVAPDVDRRTKAGKEEWAAFQVEHPGVAILKADEYQQCMAMATSVRNHSIAKKLLVGETELSATWIDPNTGVTCKGRFDVLSRIGAITDLKTTTDASREEFMNSIWRYFYHGQGAHYLNGAHEIGVPADFFCVIAVEKEPPYAVAVYNLKGDTIAAGKDELKPLLETYARCVETDVWPGYEEKAVDIDLPKWAYFKLDERLGLA